MRAFKHKRIHVLIGYAVSVGAFALAASPVMAQEKLERVEVTGSAIKRIQQEGALPVVTYTRADIEKSGATSVTEFVQNLPAMQGYQSLGESVGGGGNGVSTASIHNAGSERTLVLLNGRRLAISGGQTVLGGTVGVDLNVLPIAAIERVEVLTDGASALYGSDAIGGVLNFITKSNSAEGEAAISLTRPRGGVGENDGFAITKGFGDFNKDKFNVLLSFSHQEQKDLKATDREVTRTSVINFNYNGTPYRYGNGSGYTIPATLFTDASAIGPRAPCPAGHFLSMSGNGRCRFDYGATIVPIPESKRDSVFGSLNLKVGEQTVYSDFLYSKTDLTSRIAPAPGAVSVPLNSPLLTDPTSSLQRLAFADAGALTTSADFLLRNFDAGGRVSKYENSALHLVVGAKGQFGTWDYDTSFTHSENEQKEFYASGWMRNNSVAGVLTGVVAPYAFAPGATYPTGTLTGKGLLYDPFLGAGQNSAAAISALRAAQYVGPGVEGKTTLDIFEVHGSRSLFKMDGGDAVLAAGGSYQSEKFKLSPSDFVRGVAVSGDTIWGDQQETNPVDVNRKVIGIFGEVLMPVTKSLELTAAVRSDHYDDVGDTTNYKLSARFTPTSQWLIRGSVGTGFRAPTPAQLSASSQLYGVTGGTYDCPANLNQALCHPLQTGGSTGQTQQIAIGNPDLKPEKSDQWTIGARFEPNQHLTVGADLWEVKLKNRIDSVSEDIIYNDPVAFARYFRTYYDAGLLRNVWGVVVKNENYQTAVKRGLDFDATVKYGTGFGKLTHHLIGTVMLKDDYQIPVTNASASSLGKVGADNNVVFRTQFSLVNTLAYGGWAHTLTFNYKSGYDDQFKDDSQGDGVVNVATGASESLTRRVEENWTADWQTKYDYNKTLSFTAGILNITDRDPPVSLIVAGPHTVGYDARYADVRGRTVYGILSYKF